MASVTLVDTPASGGIAEASYLQSFTERRWGFANDAAFEITLISQALRAYIAEKDSCGEIVPLARGMLARVQTLSEVITCAITETDTEEATDENLRKIIDCTPARRPGTDQ